MKNEHDKPKKSDTQENMEAQFQQLGKDEKAPEVLKKEVFNTLDTLQLFGDFADLFTAKFAETEVKVVDVASDSKEDEEKSEKEEKS